jgi:hypothetical protein
VSYFTQELSSLRILPPPLAIGETMTANEPDAVTWQRLFASLVGDAAVDAATIREFCNMG